MFKADNQQLLKRIVEFRPYDSTYASVSPTTYISLALRRKELVGYLTPGS